MPKNGKIPTHDVSRKDTVKMNLMEFNETLTICSSLLATSIVKVSSDDVVFLLKDATSWFCFDFSVHKSRRIAAASSEISS